ncbi:MAG: NAD(P)/FAD-dependent oxidoreductase [Chloroflexi bacterium]|nr:NAD(P)/FAD-dependent oxidoreductase [Chloroflexota bacterium]
MSGERRDVIVVGGGHNGLVAAWYLAKGGLNVLVLERREQVGGACITEELWPGYRVPTCAFISHLLQGKVVADMELHRHGFQTYRLEPVGFYPYPDGRYLAVWNEEARTVAEIAKFSQRDAAAFPRFQQLRRRLAGLLHGYFFTPPPRLSEMVDRVRDTDDESLLELLLSGALGDLLEEHFESPEVRAAFAHTADGGDPYAPGSLFAAAFHWVSMFSPDDCFGIVKGGMGGITQAMAKAATAPGVEIRTNADVEQIVVESGRAVGVRLAGGEELRSRVVISDADPKRTFRYLVPRGDLPADFLGRVERLKTRVAGYKVHTRLRELPDFSRHLGRNYDPRYVAMMRIHPSLDYYRHCWNDAQHGRLAEQPVMSVQIPTIYDPTLAPPGEHVMSVWVRYAPLHPQEGQWESLRDRAANLVFDALAQYAPNMTQAVRDYIVLTPVDIESRVGLTDGSIRHLDMVLGQMLSARPLKGWADYRTPLDGLYLCGAGTHPGGEVTGAPGHNAAQAVLADLDRGAEQFARRPEALAGR